MSSQTEQQIRERLDLAIEVAKVAGRDLLEQRSSLGDQGIGVSQKSPQDFVTDMDWRSEDIIRKGLLGPFPEDGFVGEESEAAPNPEATWVVDPIDGTTNFIRGFDNWAISMALVSANKVVAGVVYCPPTDRMYSAQRGHGAQLNGSALERRHSFDRNRALVVVGFNRKMDINDHIVLIRALFDRGYDFRNSGCAAMDLIDVAEGKVDLLLIHLLQPWDVFGGLLVASEAGALGYCPEMPQFLSSSGPVLCGDPTLVIGLKPHLEQKLPELTKLSLVNHA